MTPFKSERQRKFLWKNKPEIAQKFAEEEKKLKKKRGTKSKKKK